MYAPSLHVLQHLQCVDFFLTVLNKDFPLCSVENSDMVVVWGLIQIKTPLVNCLAIMSLHCCNVMIRLKKTFNMIRKDVK